ncbi:MAG: adenylosuccinate lyase [Marinilabiliaceae bacterium]|jgi:adenylosuccinate lyase|nr:adenylosuccinate lyase [Marinilabiliaceae bacterium]
MDINKLTAISPVDGRYRDRVAVLGEYFSEYALIRYRLRTEIEYFIALCNLPLPGLEKFNTSLFERLREIYLKFTPGDAERIKEIESVTNHDVKAVEYFLKEKFSELGLDEYLEFVHFGLTSQDINNTASPLSLKEFTSDVYMPLLGELRDVLEQGASEWKDIPMLARTHGQAASPTRLGKEIMVFAARLNEQIEQLSLVPWSAKFGGATGNFNAHKVAYPGIDWHAFGENFVNDVLGLKRSYPTTQIDHYDNLAALFDAFARINTILIDFSRDIWTYISMDYFKQKIKKGEVGSSAMPHKVNPIDFENAEGNLGLANAIFKHMSSKLPVSRLQRDLTDSTVLRNTGVPAAHTLIALKSLLKGMDKVLVNRQKIDADLDSNWAVLAEAIQTVLRREGYPKPYEALLQLTRTDEKITRQQIHDFIDKLDLADKVKNELKSITPFNYTGI